MYEGERTFGNLVWKFQTPLIARNPLTSSFDLFFLEMTITEILMVKNALNNCDLQHTILPLSSYHPPFISLISLMPLMSAARYMSGHNVCWHINIPRDQNVNPVQNWVFVLNNCDSQESRRDLFSDHLSFNVQNEIGGKSAWALPMLRFVSQVFLLLHKIRLFLHNICLFLIKAGLFLHSFWKSYLYKQVKFSKWVVAIGGEEDKMRKDANYAKKKLVIVSRWRWEGKDWHTCLDTAA